jgi:hypothetical protein
VKNMSYPAKTISGETIRIVGKEFIEGGEKPILIDETGAQYTWENSDPHTLVPYTAPEPTVEEALSGDEIVDRLAAEEAAAQAAADTAAAS